MAFRISSRVRQLAILCHRWMGVAFCLLFTWWFLSGFVLMYCDFPNISDADRLSRALPLNISRVHISPADAWADLKLKSVPDLVRMKMFDGRPAYFFENRFEQQIVYADNGGPQKTFPPDLTLRIASAWTMMPAAQATRKELRDADQWTVADSFAPLRPLAKYSWPDGEEVYVSEVTGEVVQYTTSASRLGAWLGAVPHWLYFTPLRKNPVLWRKVVICLSGMGTTMALLGLIAGISTFSPLKRYRYMGRRTGIPHAGPRRAHVTLGLFFGVVTCTWTFSGMMSVDPFSFSRAEAFAQNRIEANLRPGWLRLSDFNALTPSEAMAQAPTHLRTKEMELMSFGGEPVYLLRETPARSEVVPVYDEPAPEFDENLILDLVREAVDPVELAEIHVVSRYEKYYTDRHGRLPLPVLLVQLDDPEDSMYYIDPRTARVVKSYGSRSRWNRWMSSGLHSMDLPWLYRYGPVWDVTVLVFLSGGLLLSCTSIVVAWNRLRRNVAPRKLRFGPAAIRYLTALRHRKASAIKRVTT